MDTYLRQTISLLVILLLLMPNVLAQYGGMEEVRLQFQSTSTMAMSGSNYVPTTHVLNRDGVAVLYNEYENKKTLNKRYSPGTPGGNPEIQQPIGEVPMVLILSLGIIYILLFRKKERVG